MTQPLFFKKYFRKNEKRCLQRRNYIVKYIKAFNLDSRTGIDLPGEATGIMHDSNNMTEVDLATSSFGQTIQITTLQTAVNYCAVANGGYLVQPYVVKEIKSNDGSYSKTTESKVLKQIMSKTTSDDILSALEMYNDNYIRFPIDSITALTAIPIEKNKRNGRKQALHLKLARSNKAILKEAGELKSDGRPSKRNIVIEWKKLNPGATINNCIIETGLSRSTVYKYWNEV